MMGCKFFHDTQQGVKANTAQAVVTPPATTLTQSIQHDFPSIGQSTVTVTAAPGKTLKFGKTEYQINRISPDVAFIGSGSGSWTSFNFNSALPNGTYNVIINVEYNDNTTEELRFNFVVPYSVPAPTPPPPPANAEVTMTFTPDYFNRTFSAVLNAPSGYEIKAGSGSYEIEMTSPSLQRMSQALHLSSSFSGNLPDEAGTYYFNVNCVLNDVDHTVFNFQENFTLTEADLLKPRFQYTPDNGLGSWEGALTEPGNEQFLGGSIRWLLDRVSPNPATSIEVNNSGSFDGVIRPAGEYLLNVQFKYLSSNVLRTYAYPMIFP